MLNLACHEFRSHFLPGKPHNHRSACAACDSWAERIELTITPGPDHALPAGLADRLRSIAREEGCRWVEESWRDLIDGLLPHGQQQRLDHHLESCRRCRETIASLQCFIEEAQQPLPAPLAQRLRQISSQGRRRPPVWIRQTRYAAAASYLLVMLTYATVGNPVVATVERWTPIRDSAFSALSSSKANLAERSKAAYDTSNSRWNQYRSVLWNTTRSWAEEIRASWSPSISDDDEKKGPSEDEENETP